MAPAYSTIDCIAELSRPAADLSRLKDGMRFITLDPVSRRTESLLMLEAAAAIKERPPFQLVWHINQFETVRNIHHRLTLCTVRRVYTLRKP